MSELIKAFENISVNTEDMETGNPSPEEKINEPIVFTTQTSTQPKPKGRKRYIDWKKRIRKQKRRVIIPTPQPQPQLEPPTEQQPSQIQPLVEIPM